MFVRRRDELRPREDEDSNPDFSCSFVRTKLQGRPDERVFVRTGRRGVRTSELCVGEYCSPEQYREQYFRYCSHEQ